MSRSETRMIVKMNSLAAKDQSQQQAEEQSQQQARQEHGQQQARQPKDLDRDTEKYEEKNSTEESCSQPVPKHPRSDADVQEGQRELNHKDKLRRAYRGVQEDHPDSSETATQKVHLD